MDDLITLNEAAERLGKNLRTVQRYLKNGTLEKYTKDEKHYVSVKELESKFGGPHHHAEHETKAHVVPPIIREKPHETKSDDDFWRTEAQKLQQNWTLEIEKHAQTREQLGEWKGRAEAYQAFAARLLGDGGPKDVDIDEIKKDRSVAASKEPVFGLNTIYLITLIIIGLLMLFLIIIWLKPGIF